MWAEWRPEGAREGVLRLGEGTGGPVHGGRPRSSSLGLSWTLGSISTLCGTPLLASMGRGVDPLLCEARTAGLCKAGKRGGQAHVGAWGRDKLSHPGGHWAPGAGRCWTGSAG